MAGAPRHDVLVVGSLNADLVIRAPRFPNPGETISGGDLLTIPGGKGANQAVAAARQGVKVAMVGRVGRDHFAPFLIENLNVNHVDTANVLKDDVSSGTAIIVVDENGENSIVVSPGANGRVSPQDVDSAPDARMLLLQFEIPMEAVVHAAKRYKAQGASVVLNPAPARPIPDDLLAHVDILVPNQTELALLSGVQGKDSSSRERAARELLKRGPRAVIVTLGERGALLVTNTQWMHISAYQIEAVDTTAAGDAFIGGLASKLLESEDLPAAVKFACACGALAVTQFGAQPSLPTKEEVKKFMALRED
jgi:ribokinase